MKGYVLHRDGTMTFYRKPRNRKLARKLDPKAVERAIQRLKPA